MVSFRSAAEASALKQRSLVWNAKHVVKAATCFSAQPRLQEEVVQLQAEAVAHLVVEEQLQEARAAQQLWVVVLRRFLMLAPDPSRMLLF